MANDASVRAFKCPTCGAPLEPQTGSLTMKCGYCGGTVIIPESLRVPASNSSGLNQFNLGGLDLNSLVGEAMHLPEVLSKAQNGQMNEAAQLYSQITGVSSADAMAAVKAMAAGHAVSLIPGQPGANWQQFSTSYSTPSVQISHPSSPTSKSKSSGGCSGVVIFLMIAALLVAGIVIAGFALSGNNNPLAALSFGHQTLSFGQEGIGAGMLQDARSIGVDANGNMVIADYQDGRVQLFDPTGKFVSMISLGQKVSISSLAVSRDGQIYLVHNQKIFIYDQNGNQTGQISDDNHDYNDVVIGPDGTLYALANNDSIVRFKKDGTIDLEIPDAFATAIGETELDAHLAVDGLGNMYIVGSFNYAVLKFSPEGKFINRFGSRGDGTGKFTSPQDIAVDGYGRVFVSDFYGVLVFDSDGAYINTVNIDQGVPYDLVFDGQNRLYTVTSQDKVFRLEIQKPKSN